MTYRGDRILLQRWLNKPWLLSFAATALLGARDLLDDNERRAVQDRHLAAVKTWRLKAKLPSDDED